jgi:hypothetical protein
VGGMSCTGSLLIIINYLFHCIILYLGLFCWYKFAWLPWLSNLCTGIIFICM